MLPPGESVKYTPRLRQDRQTETDERTTVRYGRGQHNDSIVLALHGVQNGVRTFRRQPFGRIADNFAWTL